MMGRLEFKKLSSKFSIKSILITAYILVILAFSATSKAEMTIDPVLVDRPSIQTSEFVGQVAMTADQTFFLIIGENEYYQLAANIDLAEYNGEVVRVTGVKVLPNVEPSTLMAEMDPLPLGQQEEGTTEVLVVLDISDSAN